MEHLARDNAEMGEHQLTIRDYLRHSNLHVDQQIFAGHSGNQAAGTEQTDTCDTAGQVLSGNKSNLVQ
jgi:hypothetical protein